MSTALQRMIEPTWAKALVYVGPDSGWSPVWALRYRGDGPFVTTTRDSEIILFVPTLGGIVEWARTHPDRVTWLELPAGVLYKWE